MTATDDAVHEALHNFPWRASRVVGYAATLPLTRQKPSGLALRRSAGCGNGAGQPSTLNLMGATVVGYTTLSLLSQRAMTHAPRHCKCAILLPSGVTRAISTHT